VQHVQPGAGAQTASEVGRLPALGKDSLQVIEQRRRYVQ
jgi:hypothetical protein